MEGTELKVHGTACKLRELYGSSLKAETELQAIS